ncbi:putative NADP-dependent oxidoreductase YfmJ [Actinomadura rubteroloni]|uniref:Putative NADP-dependent oxidoreductase YfmJ n=1 Tax=Actinomadura rubteroloni TaxID=1926885 RepID=A0A2P4US28_9ACTN|nr:NADP-dependent oxidoreductase [Actinomadura rubteroloni]POM27861.1 putative NADP-dependent oxidoreductase YfmJ [Actinomadura rubteroloni]
MKSREIRLVARPRGEPCPADFAMAETDVPAPGPGECVVRNDWISVDPYMRFRMDADPGFAPPYPLGAALTGAAVGEVVASADPDRPLGTTLLHSLGWREYAVVRTGRVVDTSAASAQSYLGVLGLPGLAAYVGLTEIARVRPGDIVFVSAATGAVGSAAGQIARRLGAARVIGSAGGPAKSARLTGLFGFDAAIDYREGDLDRRLAAAAPDGVDVYFDNVGGSHLRAALDAMRDHGRIALCGAVSRHRERPAPGADLWQAIARRLTLRGFLVLDHYHLLDEYETRAAAWVREGTLRSEETVVHGIDNAVGAFLGLLKGANTGKMLVRLT